MEFTFRGTETQFKPDPKTLDPDRKKYLPEFIALDTIDTPYVCQERSIWWIFVGFSYFAAPAANSVKPLGKEEDSLLSLCSS